jgi:hypothetical protein
MVGVRERGRILQQEFERAGKVMGGTQEGQTIDEETMKRVKKVCFLYGGGRVDWRVANVSVCVHRF